MNICVFISYVKNQPLIQSRFLVPILAGKALSAGQTPLMGDNAGDNISDKYALYKQVTVLYNLFKTNHSDIKGYMQFNALFNLKTHRRFYHFMMPKFLKCFGLDDSFLHKKLEGVDVVLPPKIDISDQAFSLYENYHKNYVGADLDLALSLIKKHYPDMLETANMVVAGKHQFIAPIFIAKRDIYDGYCQWLFTILFAIERQLASVLPERPKNQQAVCAYLSEILFNIYMTDLQKKNPKLNIQQKTVLMHEAHFKKWITYCLKNIYHFV